MGKLYLAWQYLRFYRGRSLLVIAALSLTIMLPLAIHWTIRRFQSGAESRAGQTPLVVGAKGSRFSLALNSLFFRGESLPTINQALLKRIDATGRCKTIPMLARARARGYVVVGTTPEYFSLRGLGLQSGDALVRLGDCVVGSNVAKQLELSPGDRLLSDPENAFDLSGPAPLNMRVQGVLTPSGTADDDVVFCTLKTAWILQGLGHGHFVQPADQKPKQDGNEVLEHKHAAGKENLQTVAEVTDENLATFHFHGKPDDFPLTSIILLPDSEKSDVILSGMFLDPSETCQVVRSAEVIEELMAMVAGVRGLLDGVVGLVAVACVLLVVLVIWLSLKLRASELRTLSLLGAGRLEIAAILGCELLILLSVSVCVGVGLAWVGSLFGPWILTHLVT